MIDDGLPTYAELQARTDAPPGSTWGLLGELGMVALLGPDEARRGAACVRRGEVLSLDHAIGAFGSPHRPSATHTVIDMGRGWRDDYLDAFYLQQTSQVDGLRHVAHHAHGFYAGTPAERVVAGDPAIGVNHWADHGLVGRGVLVDLVAHATRTGTPLDHLAPTAVGVGDLEVALDAQGVTLARGDMLVLHTGFVAHRAAHPDRRGHAGIEQSREMLAWLWDHRIPLVAADTNALECSPPVPTSPFTRPGAIDANDALMHPELIALLGLVIGELWRTDELAAACAADGVYDFQLVVKPLNLIGGVGSPPNATAVR